MQHWGGKQQKRKQQKLTTYGWSLSAMVLCEMEEKGREIGEERKPLHNLSKL
jgi:hypothetical protein